MIKLKRKQGSKSTVFHFPKSKEEEKEQFELLMGANLIRAFLEEANLERANFKNAILTEASLRKANLVKTNLKRALLKDAFFSNDGSITLKMQSDLEARGAIFW